MNSTALSSTDSILARAAEILAQANALQLHDPQTPRISAAARNIIAQANSWLDDVMPLLPALSPAELMPLLTPLELLHRAARSCPPAQELMNQLILKIFDAHISGHSGLTDYDLFPLIETQLRRRNPAFFGRPLAWHSLCISRWLRNFRNPARPNPHLPAADLRAQATLLRSTDLLPYLPSPSAFKSHLLS